MIPITTPNYLNKGFTIIELIIVFALIAIISSIGLMGYGNYSKSQTIESAARDVATSLNTAKSRALSQVKPSSCPLSSKLEGHKLKVVSSTTYRLLVRCKSSSGTSSDTAYPPLNLASLPASTQFRSDAIDDEYYFQILTGKVLVPGSIVILGSGGQRTVWIYSAGGINVTNP